MQCANPRSLILNIKGATDHSFLNNHSWSKYKTICILHHCNYSSKELITKPVAPYSTADSSSYLFWLLTWCYSTMVVSLLRYAFLFKFLVQTRVQSCTPECTNSLAFFPVVASLQKDATIKACLLKTTWSCYLTFQTLPIKNQNVEEKKFANVDRKNQRKVKVSS